MTHSLSFSTTAIGVNYESIMHAINIEINKGLGTSGEKRITRHYEYYSPKNTQLVKISILDKQRKRLYRLFDIPNKNKK
jgi:hypothetical protein